MVRSEMSMVARYFGDQFALDSPRRARKRGVLRRLGTEPGDGRREGARRGDTARTRPVYRSADVPVRRRLWLLNVVVSSSFTVGSALFVLGAALSALTAASPLTCAMIYLVGGVLFSGGGYAGFLQAVNAPHASSTDGTLTAGPWRWWSYHPMRIDWLTTFLLFVGTLVFGVGLLNSFVQNLSVQQTDRLVWAPDVVGCAFFLASGHLALLEVGRGRLRPLPHDLGWWIVAVNQLGSVLFSVSAIAEFSLPRTGGEISAQGANWTTLAGAVCFGVAGIVQGFERPRTGTAAS